MKLVGLFMMLAMAALAAHTFVGTSSPYSPLEPARLIRNTVGGLCAARHAVQAAADGVAFHFSPGAGGATASPSLSCSTMSALGR